MYRNLIENFMKQSLAYLLIFVTSGLCLAAPFCAPGFSLHDELVLLVAAGLTPRQALQSATLNPARFFHRSRDLGRIEQGKVADLGLLDANPIRDFGINRKLTPQSLMGVCWIGRS